ncbi:hypothetical protein [Pseudomonas sp. B21-048]|uniref:hypothetical protein n=1 Tax=Pseudomonas sp. B21-048 TaxID=2895490 RepID=UPI00215FA12E|nr:hypothetical protein [Pseudomonas sp. B21-048]UVL00809.1 hypothetical protein LOY56_10845 [Pseudomonas sp. B21-048]
MAAATPFTPDQIAQAMKAKAQDAYGEKVTDPFSVRDIEQHRADVHYTVTVNYTCQYNSRPVRYATGPMYAPSQIMAVLTHRQGALLAYPGHYREMMLTKFQSNGNLYREPMKFLLTSDGEVCCSVEDCKGCSGQGTVNCSTCNGHASYTCRQCHGQCRLRCTGCSGTGNSTHSRHCTACGGSGVYAGNGRCNQCNGSGVAGHTCGRCHGSTMMTCDGCHGGGRQNCTICNRGQVTCNTCSGARQLIYEYHLDVYADTKVLYRWSNLSAGWLDQAMKDMINAPQSHTVFSVDRYQLANEDPSVFTATGHVVAAQASVSYQGTSGSCRFIGPTLESVFLDGVLSGGFKKSVEGVKDFKNIKKVNTASSSRIARQLIKETDENVDVKHTTPVTKGIISHEDATMFIGARAQSTLHILTTRRSFRWSAVFGFSFQICKVLICLYALMSILTHGTPTVLAGNEGFFGILALMHNPKQVLSGFGQPLSYLVYNVASNHDYWQLLCWIIASMIFNRFMLSLMAPRTWDWAQRSWARLILVSVPGALLLSLFMAMHPDGFVLLRFTSFVPSFHFSLSTILTWVILYVPQIWVLSLVVSLVRYKAAGVQWGVRMMRILTQSKDVSGYWPMLK